MYFYNYTFVAYSQTKINIMKKIIQVVAVFVATEGFEKSYYVTQYFEGIQLSVSIEGNFLKIWDNGTGMQVGIISACNLKYITYKYSAE